MSDSGIGLLAHLSSPLIFSYIRTYVLSFPYMILGFLHLIINTKHQIQRNRLNQIFKTSSHHEQMIPSSSMYENHTYRVSLKEFLKILKYLAFSGIHTVSRWLDLLFKALHQERKRIKERIPTRLSWAHSVVIVLPIFIDIWYVDFS